MAVADKAIEVKDGLTPMVDRLRETLPQALQNGLLQAAQIAEGAIKRALYDTAKGGARRSGMLESTFGAALAMYNGLPAGTAVSDSIYARIQDLGGIIKPKTGKHLAVPLFDDSNPQWPRDRSDLHFIKSKAGKKLLVDESGTPQYILKEQVEIPARHYTEKAHAEAEPMISDLMGGIAQTTINEADKKNG